MTTAAFELKFLKYFEIAKVSYRHATTYIGDLISLGLLVGVRLWVLKQLYFVVYASDPTRQIGGLTTAMAVWSLTFTNSFQLGVGSRMVLQPIAEDIQSGNIAYMLNKPYLFLTYLYFSNIGRLAARLIPTLVLGIIVTLVLVGPITFTWQAVAAGIVLAGLGLSLNLVFIFIIGILAFWVEEVRPYRWVIDRIQWIIGGMVIPLTLFPDWLRKTAELLPFAQFFYGPARILVSFDQGLFIKFLLVQIFWLAVGIITLVTLFRKGIKNVSINGG